MPDDDSGAVPHPEESAEELYEGAPCALFSTLPDGTILRANQTFFDWTGTTREVVCGRLRFQQLLAVGSRIYYETHYAPLLRMQGFVSEIALEVRHLDGRISPVVATAKQLRDASGAATVNRVALFDSTDRRRYEQELLTARKRAEQAAKDLTDADRRKNEFIAMLAHELRNPLAPIRSAVEILRRKERADSTTSKATVMMQRQVAQMVRLIDDLLDASRVGQDKLTLRRVPVDLASVVHHAVEASEPLLERFGVSFTATLPPTPIYVAADAARLVQVIENVLNNAAKFTPRGGAVALTLECDGPDAVIRVRDTGIGIDESQLSRIFELFAQADTSLGRRSGLGIGLTLAKSLVERHDGQIRVHSDGLGQGAEFIIQLPALTESLRSVSHTFGPRRPEVIAEPKRVLVVDDNQDSAEMLAMLLEMLGHEVRLAHDGLGAVSESVAFQPHVVLLDIGLPKLSGYEVAQRIRKQQGAHPVLVALTGWGQEEDRLKSAAAGFDLHLVKPVDHEILATLIANLPAPGS
jgi:PAS domain S-box-containing protein